MTAQRALLAQLVLSLTVFATEAIAQSTPLRLAGHDVGLAITEVSDRTIRITLKPWDTQHVLDASPVLAPRAWPEPIFKATALPTEQTVKLNHHRVTIKPSPLTIAIASATGRLFERLTFDESSGGVSFHLAQGRFWAWEAAARGLIAAERSMR